MGIVDTLGRAISILEREMLKNPAAFTQVDNANMAKMLQALSAVIEAAAFSNVDRQKLLALVQARQNAEADDSELGAPAAAVYNTHSSSILDVLDDMKEKAEGQLAELRKAEVNTKHHYAMLKQSLTAQSAADTKDMKEEKANKAAATEAKATAEGDLAVTTKDLNEAR